MGPGQLHGKWDEGYYLDIHTLYSTFIGYDFHGNNKYDTLRSELGELVYKFKYENSIDALDLLVKLITPFIRNWSNRSCIDCIVSAPPTKIRHIQPVYQICEKISHELGITFEKEVFMKTSIEEAKNSKDIFCPSDDIVVMKIMPEYKNILIIDDIYSSGRTINKCVSVLRQAIPNTRISVLAITKTRR